MRKNYNLLLLIFFTNFALSQQGFQFDYNVTKVKISAQIINNLVFIPVEINGTQFTMLLDTGVKETVLFSYDDKDVKFYNLKKVLIRGYGKKDPFEGFTTTTNRVKVGDYFDRDQKIYLVLDQEINISSMVGIPVNGIIGYNFFKNYPVKIDYIKSKVIVYNTTNLKPSETKKFLKMPMQIMGGKPYIKAGLELENSTKIDTSKFLVDTGNSDGIWIYEDINKTIVPPKNAILDYLGKGVSGDVTGFRGRITSFKILNFLLQQPIAAFPDTLAIRQLLIDDDRIGSIGNEVLKRFTTIFDYKNETIYLHKNSFFTKPFQFDMSGIQVQHNGLEWQATSYEDKPTTGSTVFNAAGEIITQNLRYKFALKPIFIVSALRPNSPATIAGLEVGDVFINLNSKNCSDMSLQDINELLKSEENKTINLQIERKGVVHNFVFNLKKII